MAVIVPSAEQVQGGGIMLVTWTLAAGDYGRDCNYPAWADRNLQVEGTADGATVAIQGSNDGVNWRSLTDMAGNSLAALSTGSIRMIQENTLLIRPYVNGGTANTAIVVTMLARRR